MGKSKDWAKSMPRAGFTKLTMADEQKAALKKAAGVSGGKDECQL